jgi:hypothetical protein
VAAVRLIGYWRGSNSPEWPDPAAFVDESWSAHERRFVGEYLTNGQRMPYASAGVSLCRLCGKPNGADEFTDGSYLWPEGLAHYVTDHAVRLPAQVIDHIRERQSAEYWSGRVDSEWWRQQQPPGA